MENIIINIAAASVRQASLNNRVHFVAPLTLIVPGVLDGSKGPLYYPASEVRDSSDSWNHVPILVNHPKNFKRSARCEKILNDQGIGLLLNTQFSRGKLIAEGWFDIEKTNCVDPRVCDALAASRPIELSTGLFTTNEPAPYGSVFNGRIYNFIAKNYKPDHLAVLPDGVGACSVKDGCGVLVNSQTDRGPGIPPLVMDFSDRKIVDERQTKETKNKETQQTKTTGRGPGLVSPVIDWSKK